MNFENICTEKEAEFLLSNLKHTDNVLEYGNGEMALQIAPKVKHVSVITHDLIQYEKLICSGIENLEALYQKPNKKQISEDGNYLEFKDYIESGTELRNRFGKFNVIIIRGRARVECARFCEKISQSDAKIFIQDYNHPNKDYLRAEYFDVEKYLIPISGEFTMYMFKIKEQEKIEKTIEDNILYKNTAPKKTITQFPPKEQKRIKEVANKIFNNK